MSTLVLFTAPLGILCGIGEIIVGVIQSPVNAGNLALGLIFILVNGFALMLAITIRSN